MKRIVIVAAALGTAALVTGAAAGLGAAEEATSEEAALETSVTSEAGAAEDASLDEVVGSIPAVADATVPSQPEDLGVGEHLVLVVGGTYPTRREALAANAALTFGDVQGYYAVPIAQFDGLRAIYPNGDWALVSAFRTGEGAGEFAAFARMMGAPAELTVRVRSLGGFFAGLGQEARPDGLGPLQGPIPASLRGDA